MIELIHGDNRQTLSDLATIRGKFVQAVVTSPPYWGVRTYEDVPTTIWQPFECVHDFYHVGSWHRAPMGPKAISPNRKGNVFDASAGKVCKKCGGYEGHFGLEPLVDCGRVQMPRCQVCYVCHTLDLFDRLEKVLKDDGIIFWNVGDGYWASALQLNDNNPYEKFLRTKKGQILVPHRVALALQEEGWLIRSTIIWEKAGGLGESVYDRPTNTYEYIFMITKSGKYSSNFKAIEQDTVDGKGKKNIRNIWRFSTATKKSIHAARFPDELPRRCILASTKEGDMVLDPFAGSGTTLRVANELKRRAVGCEISPAYYNDTSSNLGLEKKYVIVPQPTVTSGNSAQGTLF